MSNLVVSLSGRRDNVPGPGAGVAVTDAHARPVPAPQKATDKLDGLFRDGFEFKSADGSNLLRIGASFHLDARAFFGDSVAPSSFDIRRARIDLRGQLRRWMTYRIKAAMENEPHIRNAWLDLGWSDAFHLRAGRHEGPVLDLLGRP